MFNRAIQVKVVKTKKPEKAASDTTPTVDYVHIARQTAKDVAVGAAALIGTYMALDTLRQVTVKIVEAKL